MRSRHRSREDIEETKRELRRLDEKTISIIIDEYAKSKSCDYDDLALLRYLAKHRYSEPELIIE